MAVCEGFVRRVFHGSGAFVAGVSDTIKPGLDAAAADGEVKGSVVSDGEVGERERLSGDEFFEVRGVSRAAGFEVDGIEFAVGPVGDEEGLLVFRGELGSGAKGHAGG